MTMWEAPPLPSLLATLSDPTLPVGMRMRATYYLRQVYDNYVKNHPDVIREELDGENVDGTATATMSTTTSAASRNITKRDGEKEDSNAASNICNRNSSDIANDYEKDDGAETDLSWTVLHALTTALSNIHHGCLLRHEFAYVLGQLRDVRSVQSLERTLLNVHDDTMVRHESAEALGAIGSISCLPTLQKVAKEDASIEVGQTCLLALEFIRWKEKKKRGGVKSDYATMSEQKEEEEEEEEIVVCACMLPPYSSVDPAPPHPKHVSLSSHEIGTILRDVNAPLFERFRAMFSLRNRGGEDCVKELGNALVMDESSALLRHEVAYVLGQMQHPHSVEYLACSLERSNEHRMVRHESAEALGAIEERWGECESILRKFLEDEDDVVRESCVVALDAADYWGYNNQVVDDGDDADDLENEDESKSDGEKQLDPVVGDVFEKGEQRHVNFSLHKAQSNGKANTSTMMLRPEGVLHNHFNIAAS